MGAMPLQHEVHYPESDGKPMAESTIHWNVMVDTAQVLRRHFEETPDVWVGSNLFVYYERGVPSAVVAPDVLVVQGVPKWNRPTFKVWEEKQVPCFVLEVTSASTRREDSKDKKATYERLGVGEYVLFDPLGDYLKPRLQGFRFAGSRYEPVALSADGSLLSRTTGLWLRAEGERLRLADASTGAPLLWTDEIEAALRAAEERAALAEAARRTLEEELGRLRSELGRRPPRT